MFHNQNLQTMRNYFFIITRSDSTKFIVMKSCKPSEVAAISESLGANNFSCVWYSLEDCNKDSMTLMRSILNELRFTDIHEYDTYIKKVNEEEEMFKTFYDKVSELTEKAEEEGEDVEILLCEEVGGIYTITDDYGNEFSKHVWVDYISIDELGEISVYNSDNYSDTYLFSKLNKTAQVEIIKVFLRTIEEQDNYD